MSCEILAPAGSKESLVSAVRSGADAVYLGLSNFSARHSAENFTADELSEAVDYCSKRGVKTYLTLNTLIADSELNEALDCVKVAASAGVNGIIVQDLGLASIIKKACPELRLHASTQMAVHSPSALPMLKRMGFDRVVLARELSADEILAVTKEAHTLGIETEVFVHGALCMCLSGQCYMSGVIGRRSGNRGRCAQPCRLEFENGQYPLSLKDLSLIDYVAELEKQGVKSLKIEGRMKRPEYVAAAVSAFRNTVDNGFLSHTQRELLSDVFSRSGHTDGYYKKKLGADMFGHRTDADVISSAQTVKRVHELYRNERQSVEVALKLNVPKGAPSTLEITDNFGNAFVAEGEVAGRALNRPLDFDYAKRLCEKLGGTPFLAVDFSADIDDGLMLPASAVNELRRKAVDGLMEKRAAAKKRFATIKIQTKPPQEKAKTKIYARFASAAQVPKGSLSMLDRIYLPLGERFEDFGIETGVELPRAFFCGEAQVEKQLKELPKSVKWALCNNLAAVELAKKHGLKAHAGFGMNIFNSLALEVASDFADDVTLSFELALSQARAVRSGGYIAYGRAPLMLTRNCPLADKFNCSKCKGELVDRKGKRFLVQCKNRYSEVYNCLPTALSFEKDKLDGFDFIELMFTDETPERCAQIISDYAERRQPEGEFTHLLAYRGVL